MIRKFGAERATGLMFVLALHALALWGLWTHRLIPMPDEAATLFVDFIAPPPKPVEPPKPKLTPPPRPVEQPRQLVAEAPVVSPTEPVAPPPPPKPAPAIEAPAAAPAPAPKPAGPVTLGAGLSVACPERTPPRYPPASRRLGEFGTTVLRVELDEQGQVARAAVATSSGFPRLDDAARAAVQTWRCTPAHRDGQAVKAVALQPFKFVLE